MTTDKKRYQTYINDELSSSLIAFANQHNLSLSNAIEVILSNYLLGDQSMATQSLVTVDLVKSMIDEALETFKREYLKDESVIDSPIELLSNKAIITFIDSDNIPKYWSNGNNWTTTQEKAKIYADKDKLNQQLTRLKTKYPNLSISATFE